MSKILYGRIVIEAKACECDTNKREMDLADALWAIADRLERWLKKEKAGAGFFEFEVETE